MKFLTNPRFWMDLRVIAALACYAALSFPAAAYLMRAQRWRRYFDNGTLGMLFLLSPVTLLIALVVTLVRGILAAPAFLGRTACGGTIEPPFDSRRSRLRKAGRVAYGAPASARVAGQARPPEARPPRADRPVTV